MKNGGKGRIPYTLIYFSSILLVVSPHIRVWGTFGTTHMEENETQRARGGTKDQNGEMRNVKALI